ncbi:MAG: protein kinase, partial [Gemmatimonadales bacterium]|nr:protein kinase [Gemmatimonadales bacterium]
IRIAAQLQHPNILPLHDSGEADGFLYYVMPYVEGESLRERLSGQEGGPLGISEAVRILREVVDALASAHAKGVVHRDIKPANILLSGAHAFVTDFGVAKAVSEATGRQNLTTAGMALGTPAYMAPEQATADPNIDHRADIYAAGALSYELLTGQPPFHGTSPQAVLAAHVTQAPVPITQRRQDIPPGLASLVMRCLAKDPNDRPQTATELLPALESITVSGETTPSLHPISPRQRFRRWALIGGAVVTAAALIFVFNQGSGGDPTASAVSADAVAVLPFSVRGSEEFSYLGEGMVNLLNTKLDGAGDLRTVDPRALLSHVSREKTGTLDPAEGRTVAERFGAGLYIMGDIVEVGGNLQITASLYDVGQGQAAVGEATASGTADELMTSLVDQLAAGLLIKMRGGPGARVTRLAGVTTASLPAYRAYLEGEAAFRAGRYEAATAAHQRAVALDSLFALAYYRLSLAAEYATREDISIAAASQALRHAGRLSDHDRRFLEGFVAWRQGAHAQAEQIYREILGTYPDDVEAWFQIGEVLFHANPLHGRSLTESRDAFERVLEYEPNDPTSLIHLARIAVVEQRFDDVDTIIQEFLTQSPGSDRELELLALQAFAKNDSEMVDRVLDRLKRATDIPVAMAALDVAAWGQHPRGTERLATILTQPTRSSQVRGIGHAWLAHTMLSTGRWQAARAQLDAYARLDPATALEFRAALAMLPFLPTPASEIEALLQELRRVDPSRIPAAGGNPFVYFNPHHAVHPLVLEYLKGQLAARVGKTAEAQEHANRLRSIAVPEGSGTLATDFASSIESQASYRAGRPNEALKLIEQVRSETFYQGTLTSPLRAGAFERFWRAELLNEAGREQEALAWYRQISNISVYELVYLPISHLRQGEIHDRLGENAIAIDHYAKFIDLWRDADEALQPLVRDAEERVAQLSQEPHTN